MFMILLFLIIKSSVLSFKDSILGKKINSFVCNSINNDS